MNTYDAAYALAKEIKESDEMKRLTEAAEKIKGDEEARKMVKEYIMAQMKSDYARTAGQKEDEEALQALAGTGCTRQQQQQCAGIPAGIHSLESSSCGSAEDRI